MATRLAPARRIDVFRDSITEAGPHQFVVDASELGLRPGEWPCALVLSDFGNRRPLFASAMPQRDGSVLYRQEFGCVTLRVYND